MTLHTEAAAKKLWCPFARVWNDAEFYEDDATFVRQAGVFNRMPWFGNDRPSSHNEKANSHTLCIASECMAWRWDRAVSEAEFSKQAEDGQPRAPKGYCGLATDPYPLVYTPPSGPVPY